MSKNTKKILVGMVGIAILISIAFLAIGSNTRSQDKQLANIMWAD